MDEVPVDEAFAWLLGRDHKPALIIFDCDGVLIDSEPATNRVVAEVLTELGWAMDAVEAYDRFVGMSFYSMQPVIETRLGRSLGAGWVDDLVTRLVGVLASEVETVPGARETLEGVSALGLPWRIASNSSHTEMAAKFTRTGLAELVAGRLHSAVDVIAAGGRGKPAPDLFLAAAGIEGVAPERCLVIEDSVAGVTAAVAAGMGCLGFDPHAGGAMLRAAGAMPIHRLDHVPMLLRALLERSA